MILAISTTADGNTIIYTRAADRSTAFLETIGDFLTFAGGDSIWKSFQTKVAAFVNSNGGTAAIVARFCQRFKWSVVKIILSPQGSSAEALAAMIVSANKEAESRNGLSEGTRQRELQPELG